jgi:hypothetical protein
MTNHPKYHQKWIQRQNKFWKIVAKPFPTIFVSLSADPGQARGSAPGNRRFRLNSSTTNSQQLLNNNFSKTVQQQLLNDR